MAYLTFFFARGHTIWMIQIIRQKVSYQTMLFPKGRPIQMIWVICKKMAYFTVLFARGQPIQIIPVNYLQTDTKRGLPLMFQFFNWPLFLLQYKS